MNLVRLAKVALKKKKLPASIPLSSSYEAKNIKARERASRVRATKTETSELYQK